MRVYMGGVSCSMLCVLILCFCHKESLQDCVECEGVTNTHANVASRLQLGTGHQTDAISNRHDNASLNKSCPYVDKKGPQTFRTVINIQ